MALREIRVPPCLPVEPELDRPFMVSPAVARAYSSPGAKPRRMVFSQIARGSTKWSR